MPARRPSSAPASRPGARAGLRPGQGSSRRPAAPRERTAAHGSVPASARGNGARAILNRPAGPDRTQRRRSRYGIPQLEVLTVRLLVLTVVVLLATVLLVPTVRAAVQQQMELHQVRSALEQRQAQADALQRELDRWEDPAYVEGQARDKLQYAMPGDHVWRVIGGDDVVEDLDPVTGEPVDDGVVGALTSDGTPWYAALWESVRTADGPPASDEPDPDGSTTPADEASDAPATGASAPPGSETPESETPETPDGDGEPAAPASGD